MTPNQILALRDEAERLLKAITDGKHGWQAEMSSDDARHRIEVPHGYKPTTHIGYAGRWPDAEFIAAAPRLVRQLLDALTVVRGEEALKAQDYTRVDGQPDSDGRPTAAGYEAIQPSERDIFAELCETKRERDGEHRKVLALTNIIRWALGEVGEFPSRPADFDTRRYRPFYWWRGEMRHRLERALSPIAREAGTSGSVSTVNDGENTIDTPVLPTDVQAVIAEMTEALCQGAFFNPEKFGWLLKPGDNPILRWRDTLEAVLRQSAIPPADTELTVLRQTVEAQADELAYLRRHNEEQARLLLAIAAGGEQEK